MELYKKTLTVAADASGAYQAARIGQAVLIVDVIDMGTTAEAALQAGASLVIGASPIPNKAPVPVDPEAIGRYAARAAGDLRTGIVLIAEPRVGSEAERIGRAAGVLRGMRQEGKEPLGIYPNLGAETARLVDFKDKVVVVVSDCGGTAFDTAFNMGVPVFTATTARTFGKTGWENADAGIRRALRGAVKEERGLCIVAASSKALEDVLAAHYLAQRAVAEGFNCIL